MNAIGLKQLSLWHWDNTAPVAKLDASHSSWKGLLSEGKANVGADVTPNLSLLKVEFLLSPQDQLCFL